MKPITVPRLAFNMRHASNTLNYYYLSWLQISQYLIHLMLLPAYIKPFSSPNIFEIYENRS